MKEEESKRVRVMKEEEEEEAKRVRVMKEEE